MPEQLDLTLRARLEDPATSHAAAAQAGEFAADHYTLIVGSLGLHGTQTIYELAAHTKLDHVAVARRMKELEEQGRVHRTAETRPSPRGRACTVWAAGAA